MTINCNNIYEYINRHPEYKVCIYGAGIKGIEKGAAFERIDFYCDMRADSIGSVRGIPCLNPQELEKINGPVIVILCIKSPKYRDEACRLLGNLKCDIELFDLYNNEAFATFDNSKYSYEEDKKEFRINIVCPDKGWILSKFSERLKMEVSKEGYSITVSEFEDMDAEINHFIGYHILTEINKHSKTVRTTMITHVDTNEKRELISFQADNGVTGICMSADTMNKLASWGIPRNRLCYINPAQDGEIKPKKIVLGITYRCHGKEDFRKRDDEIVSICEVLNPEFFLIKIMGDGWEDIVDDLSKLGFEVEYHPQFDRDIYIKLMPSLDYWVYYGFDEGAMGYLDALAAGIRTIATPQGYHLDSRCGLTHPCSTIDDFRKVLLEIQKEREEIVNAVTEWTWDNYAKKHIEVWKYLLSCAPLSDLYRHQGEYSDGIFSMLLEDNRVV